MTNITALLQQPVAVPAWIGNWARIWMRPDVFSAQEYIVGAVALDGPKVVDFRVLTSPDRFECIYGEDTKAVFERLLNELRHSLTEARAANAVPTGFPSAVFRLEVVGRLRTQLVADGLERMLRDGTIPLEPDEPTGKKQRFVSRAATEVVNEVMAKVKIRAGLLADKFIRDDAVGTSAHKAAVNLITPRAAGIVASGWYGSYDRIRVEFLLAASQVETYSAATHRAKSAVFFVRPTSANGLAPSVWKAVDSELDLLEWRMQEKGGIVFSHDQADVVAQHVVSWAAAYA